MLSISPCFMLNLKWFKYYANTTVLKICIFGTQYPHTQILTQLFYHCLGTGEKRQGYKQKFSSVQSLSHVRLLATPWTAARQASLSITNSWSLPKPMSIVIGVSDAIQPSHPLLSPSPPVLNLSQHQGLFKWVISSHQVAKVLEFQLQHQSFQGKPRTDL